MIHTLAERLHLGAWHLRSAALQLAQLVRSAWLHALCGPSGAQNLLNNDSTAVVVYLTNHVLSQQAAFSIAPLEWPPRWPRKASELVRDRWHFPAAAVCAALLMTALSFAPLPPKAHGVVCPMARSLRSLWDAGQASGTIFGLGLGVAGMTSQADVSAVFLQSFQVFTGFQPFLRPR